jgi:hypothetical protein
VFNAICDPISEKPDRVVATPEPTIASAENVTEAPPVGKATTAAVIPITDIIAEIPYIKPCFAL